jgi:hypothetical protein
MSHVGSFSGHKSEPAHISFIKLTLNLQVLFPVDDFWRVKQFLTVLRVLGVDEVSIGVVIKVICHILLSLRNKG